MADEEMFIGETGFGDINSFVEIRSEAYLQQAAILVVHFVGRGDTGKARRAFMNVALQVFDATAESYGNRSFARRLDRIKQRSQQRAAAPAETEPAPDGTAVHAREEEPKPEEPK